MPRQPTAYRNPVPAKLAVHQSQAEIDRARTLATSRQAKRKLATNSAAWRTLRQYVLNRNPLCVECQAESRITVANEVDHIDGDASNNALVNLQGLCKSHHSRKTARENGGFGNAGGGGFGSKVDRSRYARPSRFLTSPESKS